MTRRKQGANAAPPGPRSLGLSIAAVLLLIFAPACKEPRRAVPGPRVLGPNTRVVKIGSLQIGLDLMVMESPRHDVMVNRMKMKRDMPASHAVMISVLDAATRKRVRDARVEVAVAGGGKQTIRRKATPMAGNGMYHYSAHFNLAKQAVYLVTAAIRVSGKRYIARARFDTSKLREK